MTRRRPAAYEIYIMLLLVLFWGCIGLNRVGIGLIFPKIVPEFHMDLVGRPADFRHLRHLGV